MSQPDTNGRRVLDQAAWLMWRSGISDLVRKALVRKGCFVLMFHGISKRKHPEIPLGVQPYLSKEELHQTLSWVNDRFDFLTPDSLLESCERGVLLTFDDGFANNLSNALPVLEEFDAPAVFFVTTQHVEKPDNWLHFVHTASRQYWGETKDIPGHLAEDFYQGLSKDKLASCAQHPLVTIGSHSVCHPDLTSLNDQQLDYELNESKCYLEALTNSNINLFAYPGGEYDSRVAEAVRDSGYRAAFAIADHKTGLPIYNIPRIGIYDHKPAYLSLKLSGLYRPAIDTLTANRVRDEGR